MSDFSKRYPNISKFFDEELPEYKEGSKLPRYTNMVDKANKSSLQDIVAGRSKDNPVEINKGVQDASRSYENLLADGILNSTTGYPEKKDSFSNLINKYTTLVDNVNAEKSPKVHDRTVVPTQLMSAYLKDVHPEMLQNINSLKEEDKQNPDFKKENLEYSKKVAGEITGLGTAGNYQPPNSITVDPSIEDDRLVNGKLEGGDYGFYIPSTDSLSINRDFNPATMTHEFAHKKYPARMIKENEEKIFDTRTTKTPEELYSALSKNSGNHFTHIPIVPSDEDELATYEKEGSYTPMLGEPALYYNKFQSLLKSLKEGK